MPPMLPKAEPCILLTGATGFLGKVVLEELFRRHNEFKFTKVILLIRSKRDRDVRARFHEDVVTSACFSMLSSEWVESVQVVAGDLRQHKCGLDAATYESVCKETTHIIHCAGSVKFDMPVAEAAAANITSSLNMLELAQNSPRLERMVSTSTAYVTPHTSAPIGEVLALLPRPAAELFEDMQTGRVSQVDLLHSTSHPNTYTLTKCVAEHLMMERRNLVPLTIVRPSIISASRHHPFPGWIDSQAAFAGFVVVVGSGLLHVVDCDPQALLDIVPVDEVSRRLIDEALLVQRAINDSPIIYTVATLKHGFQIGTMSHIAVKLLNQHRVGRRPKLCYIGSRNLRYHFYEYTRQKLPADVAKIYFGLRGNTKMLRRTELLANTLNTINEVFSYFTHHTFDFRPSVPLTGDFDIESYVRLVTLGVRKHLMQRDATQVLLGGRAHKATEGDIKWCFSRPQGNLAIRISAVILRKTLRKIFDQVTFDQLSFDRALELVDKDEHVVIVPTHRSYMDFLVCSYLFFARPDLDIKIPYIAAAQEFAEMLGIGWWFKQMHAFYLTRGQGKADPKVNVQIKALVDQGETLLFFIEGQRSRSRQFLSPRRGLLRSLQNTGERFAALPVSISCDRVAEETPFLRELKGERKGKPLLRDLARWTWRMARGKVQLGRMHIRCGEPLPFDKNTNVHPLSHMLMEQLQTNTVATTFHLQCFVQRHFQSGLDVSWLCAAIVDRGGAVVDSAMAEHQVGDLDPVLERCLRHHWMHLFFNEGLAQQTQNPALAHYVKENGYSRGTSPRVKLPDERITILLFYLFEPICADYSKVACAVKRYVGIDKPVAVELHQTDYADYTTAQSALRCLIEHNLLIPSNCGGNHYQVAARESDLNIFIDACAWPMPPSLLNDKSES